MNLPDIVAFATQMSDHIADASILSRASQFERTLNGRFIFRHASHVASGLPGAFNLNFRQGLGCAAVSAKAISFY